MTNTRATAIVSYVFSLRSFEVRTVVPRPACPAVRISSGSRHGGTSPPWHRLNTYIMLAAMTLTGAAGCKDGAPATPAAPEKGVHEVWSVTHLARVPLHSPGLEKLKGIAVGPDGRFYLAHAGGVAVFDRQWNRAADLPTEGQAVAVTVHDDGRVFVAERQKVHVFGPDGAPLGSWGTPGKERGQLGFLAGIAVRGGDVWLADAGNRVIHRFDTTGDFIADIGGRDDESGRPSILCPSPYLDCAVAADGTLYNTNPGRWQVEHTDLNGKLVGTWGRQGSEWSEFSGCCNPTNVAVLPDGRIVTGEKGIPRVKVIDAENHQLHVGGPEHFAEGAAGLDLAVGADGAIYVVDPAAGKVLAFRIREGQ